MPIIFGSICNANQQKTNAIIRDISESYLVVSVVRNECKVEIIRDADIYFNFLIYFNVTANMKKYHFKYNHYNRSAHEWGYSKWFHVGRQFCNGLKFNTWNEQFKTSNIMIVIAKQMQSLKTKK